MTYDGRALASARTELESIRERNSAEHERRLKQVYHKVPEIEDIDARLRAQMGQLVAAAASGGAAAKGKIAEIRDANLSLQMRKAELLVENGYPSDYLNDIYSCERCRDTGVYNQGVCSCLQKLYKKELSRELSPLMRAGNESFDNFDLSLYPSVYNAEYSCVPAEYMGKVLAACKKFAEDFPAVSSNLLLAGGAGLGKTYLSACIAREVSSRGSSVCYRTASQAFDSFEAEKFSRDPDEAAAAAKSVKRMLDCDLMILDDLGTELVTPASSSALYTLINTRINEKRPMVINTNLTSADIAKKYSPAVASRLEGEFMRLVFIGNDIRLILKSR